MACLSLLPRRRSNRDALESPEGLARCQAASLTHGLTARRTVLGNESMDDFRALREAYVLQFQPESRFEVDMVDELAAARWRLDRAISLEVTLLDLEMERQEPEIQKEFDVCDAETRTAIAYRALCDETRVLGALDRHEAHLQRIYDRVLKLLETRRDSREKEKVHQGPSPKNGQSPYAAVHHFSSHSSPLGSRCPIASTMESVPATMPQHLQPRRPEWLRAPAPAGENYRQLKTLIGGLRLHTVCESAACPNVGECWNNRTATFMILGNVCTRRCGFCAVQKGAPLAVDTDEPNRVAEAAAAMGLKYAVVTSVNRDDPKDGGAELFALTIRAIRERVPECGVEVLIPDFQGKLEAVESVMEARPDVLNHNTETVPRLYRQVRLGARYERSLDVLEYAGRLAPHTLGGDLHVFSFLQNLELRHRLEVLRLPPLISSARTRSMS